MHHWYKSYGDFWWRGHFRYGRKNIKNINIKKGNVIVGNLNKSKLLKCLLQVAGRENIKQNFFFKSFFLKIFIKSVCFPLFKNLFLQNSSQQRPMAHPVVSRYLSYSTMLADHGRHVCCCLLIWNTLPKGCAMTIAQITSWPW